MKQALRRKYMIRVKLARGRVVFHGRDMFLRTILQRLSQTQVLLPLPNGAPLLALLQQNIDHRIGQEETPATCLESEARAVVV